ncbi:hypothetical protein [Chondromyces crocatus]|uniref:PpiC domain-containing protein n=1 Tax=Chondromyces crocatus TaxID=52 RepID=A0A0K1E6K4_CHOCO|nr:hypothetical protein [Chondromyces crocatus]AKT36505.1 uncharacterized protein CMC5_006210 [Chondromyces crocatus]
MGARKRAAALLWLCMTFAAVTTPSLAQPVAKPAPKAVMVDRVVVRWHSPETGGEDRPQFIFARELAFEARLEALADPDQEAASFLDRHVRAAMDRHIAETMLASLTTDPSPRPEEIAARAEAAREALIQRVRGKERLLAAMRAEGFASDELDTFLRRQARASLYLDRMVTPMLEPSEYELRAALRSGSTPFKDQRFSDVLPLLKRWYVSQRLAQALDTYFQNARARVVVSLLRAR